jgi:site-specific DNA-methyltransferase (adenine-specific)
MRERTSGVRLVWPGRDSGPSVVKASRPVAAELELTNAGEERARLIRGDNLEALRALSAAGTQAALVYMDPPFFTGREHTLVERTRGPRGVTRRETEGFDDRWESLDAYLGAVVERVAVARQLLLPEGCLVLHVDPRTSHYLKVLCDEIFGVDCFASEIVWRYRRWPAKTRNFQRMHDVLLRYVRDPKALPRFRQLYEPLAASTRATWGDRKQRAVVDASGKRLRSSSTAEPTPGTPLGDVWEIGIVAPVAKERTGYPTQKPEALLERLVTSCTEPGDLVIDPYAGSGTTAAVCARLERRSIAIDLNRRALTICERRLRALGVDPRAERVIECEEPKELPSSTPAAALSEAG